jgi:hypothetical protein
MLRSAAPVLSGALHVHGLYSSGTPILLFLATAGLFRRTSCILRIAVFSLRLAGLQLAGIMFAACPNSRNGHRPKGYLIPECFVANSYFSQVSTAAEIWEVWTLYIQLAWLRAISVDQIVERYRAWIAGLKQ